MRDDFEALVEVVVNEECVDEHEDRFGDAQGIFERSRGLGLEMLDGVVPNVSNGSSSKCRHLGQLDVLVHPELLLERSHRIPYDLFIGANTDDLKGVFTGVSEHKHIRIYEIRTCSDEAIPRQVLSCYHGFQKEAILGVLRYAQVGDTWCQKVSWQLNVYGYAVASLFLEDDVFDGRKWRKRRELLCKGNDIVNAAFKSQQGPD